MQNLLWIWWLNLQVAVDRGLGHTRAKNPLCITFPSALPLLFWPLDCLGPPPAHSRALPKTSSGSSGPCSGESWHLPGWRFLSCSGNLWQVLNHPWGGACVQFFLISEFPLLQVMPVASCPFVVSHKKESDSSSLNPHGSLRRVLNPSLSIFSSSWINPACSLLCSRIFTALVALCWIHSSFSVPFFFFFCSNPDVCVF